MRATLGACLPYFSFILLPTGLSPLLVIGRRQSVLATSSYRPLTFPKPSNFLSPRQFWLSLPHYSQHTQLTAALGWRLAHNDSNYRRSE